MQLIELKRVVPSWATEFSDRANHKSSGASATNHGPSYASDWPPSPASAASQHRRRRRRKNDRANSSSNWAAANAAAAAISCATTTSKTSFSPIRPFFLSISLDAIDFFLLFFLTFFFSIFSSFFHFNSFVLFMVSIYSNVFFFLFQWICWTSFELFF